MKNTKLLVISLVSMLGLVGCGKNPEPDMMSLLNLCNLRNVLVMFQTTTLYMKS